MFTPTYSLLEQALIALTAADINDESATLKNAWLGLAAANFTPTPTLVLANLTEANFDGYARKQLSSYSGPFIGQGALLLSAPPGVVWQPTGNDTVNTIFGHFIVGNDSTTLLASEVFNSPIPLGSNSYAFTDQVKIGLDPGANYGSSIVNQ